MKKERVERTIHHLQGLYTVVVGLALSAAIFNIINNNENELLVKLNFLPYFIAYLITLIPFYHGALRHFDVTYIEDFDKNTKPGALLMDFSILFLESCILLGLAFLIKTPNSFCYLLAVLFVFDTIWAFLAHLAFTPKKTTFRPEKKWGWINLLTAALLIFVYIYLNIENTKGMNVINYRWIAILTITILRTVIDYTFCWDYYHPLCED